MVTVATGARRSSFLDRQVLSLLRRRIGEAPVALRLWDGTEAGPPVSSALGAVIFADRTALYRLLVDLELGFGDGYSQGRIEVEGDLLTVLEAAARRMTGGDGRRWLADIISPWLDRLQANTLAAARRDIHRHYDIGTDFYALWLDRELVYTCAYFEQPGNTLEAAQIAKMDLICRKLRLQRGDRVIEAGCGWGALSLHMARRYGAQVTAFNISKDQLAHARAAAQRAGLTDRVTFVEDDYRNIRGSFDAFVSVGMLEHVGLAYYETLGEVIDRCLTPAGRGLLHFIGRNRPQGVSLWTKKRLFPGTYCPTLAEAMRVLEGHDFSVLDVENLRLHYARTLEHWLARYERSQERVQQMFGAEFVRAWRLYLAASIVTFRIGSAQLFQIGFARAANNDIPATRAHLFAPAVAADEWNASMR